MRISPRSIEEVRESANIVEVASEFTALQRQGTRYVGLCPYPDHSEKTPSFSVSPEKGFYYCFGCQRGGDGIKLVSELNSFTFVEAVTYLAERSGVELEFEGGANPEAVQKRNQRRRNIHKALAAAAVYYHKYLLQASSPDAEHGRNYLKKRGLELSTIEEFRIGLAPPRGGGGFLGAIRKLGMQREVLEAAGLVSPRGGERFAGRITFPISDRRGRIVGFGARALGDAQPKYLNSPETEIFNKRDLLYGFPQVMEAIRRERAALMVEGYTDVLMLYQSGIQNAVATLGTATTPGHLRALSGYADKIYVVFDPDAAGEKAIDRAATTAAELRLDLRVLRLPDDPADWLLEHPPDEFKGLLSDATPILEYVFRRKAERVRGAGAAERSRAVADIRTLIGQIEDPVFYQDAVRIGAEALNVPPAALQKPGQPGRASPAADQSPATTAGTDYLLQAGREVLSLMLNEPGSAKKLLAEGFSANDSQDHPALREEDFGDQEQARLFSLLKEHGGDLDAVLADDRARSLMDLIGALSSAPGALHPSEPTAKEAWLRLAILSRERSKQKTRDYDEKMRLHTEIQALKDSLRAFVAES